MSSPRFMLRAAVMLGRSLLSCDPAPHTLRYIHCFARIEIAQKRRRFVVPLITRRAISNQILLILLILSKTSTRSTRLTIFSFVYLVYFVVQISLRTLRLCASALKNTRPTRLPFFTLTLTLTFTFIQKGHFYTFILQTLPLGHKNSCLSTLSFSNRLANTNLAYHHLPNNCL